MKIGNKPILLKNYCQDKEVIEGLVEYLKRVLYFDESMKKLSNEFFDRLKNRGGI